MNTRIDVTFAAYDFCDATVSFCIIYYLVSRDRAFDAEIWHLSLVHDYRVKQSSFRYQTKPMLTNFKLSKL